MKNATHISADGITYGLYYFSCLLDGKHTMHCVTTFFCYQRTVPSDNFLYVWQYI